jgi:TctA family transporter
MVFLERPISAAMLGLAALAIIIASLPMFYKKREETFKEE